MARPVDQQIKLEWPKVSIVNLSNAVFNSISLNMPGSSDFFFLGFIPCKAEQPLRGMELQEKETQKITCRKSVWKEPTVKDVC